MKLHVLQRFLVLMISLLFFVSTYTHLALTWKESSVVDRFDGTDPFRDEAYDLWR